MYVQTNLIAIIYKVQKRNFTKQRPQLIFAQETTLDSNLSITRKSSITPLRKKQKIL